MTLSDSSERLWSQAVDDGDYETAADLQVAAEAAERRRERLRTTLAAYTNPLFTPPILPRDMDCIDKRRLDFGSIEP